MDKMNGLWEKAYAIALKAHEGQIDKAGQPYINHPLRVAQDVDEPELKVIALLHDVLEDSDWTEEMLVREGIPEELVCVVCLLTRDTVTTPDYLEYVRIVSRNRRARKVKMADLRHNMDITRIPNPKEKDFNRLERYKKAYAILEQAELDDEVIGRE